MRAVDRDDARHAEYRWEHAARPPGPDLRLRGSELVRQRVPLPRDRGCDSPRRPNSATKIVPSSVSITRFHRASKNASGCIPTLSLRPTGSNRGAVGGLLTTSGAGEDACSSGLAVGPESAVGLSFPLGSHPDGTVAFRMARWTQCRGTLLLILHVELADRPVR